MLQKSELGVLFFERKKDPPLGKQRFFYEDMLASYPDRPFDVFFFTPFSWEPGREAVLGYVFENGAWRRSMQHIPELIYDRAHSMSPRQKVQAKKVRHYLTASGKRILNPLELVRTLGSKVKFHQFLLQAGIPTLKVADFDVVNDSAVFEQLGASKLYLKPRFGSSGKGIYVLEKEKDRLVFFTRDGTPKYFNQHEALLIHLHTIIKDPSRYFIQPAADTYPYQEAAFDIRVLVQNYGPEYRVTGMGARIGRKKSLISNLNSGGVALPVEALAVFFKKTYGREVQEEIRQIKALCLQCAKALDQAFGPFLEVGFDILCTKKRGPVILEGNSKPSRWIFNVIADQLSGKEEEVYRFKQLRKETVRVPLVYAKYLLFRK